jgi:hypothetical protein
VFLFVVVWINDDDTVLILAWSDLVMKKKIVLDFGRAVIVL